MKNEATRRIRTGDLLITNQSQAVIYGRWRTNRPPRSQKYSTFPRRAPARSLRGSLRAGLRSARARNL